MGFSFPCSKQWRHLHLGASTLNCNHHRRHVTARLKVGIHTDFEQPPPPLLTDVTDCQGTFLGALQLLFPLREVGLQNTQCGLSLCVLLGVVIRGRNEAFPIPWGGFVRIWKISLSRYTVETGHPLRFQPGTCNQGQRHFTGGAPSKSRLAAAWKEERKLSSLWVRFSFLPQCGETSKGLQSPVLRWARVT